MARIGREYEEAVYAFVKALDPTADVFFDKSVVDLDTGRPRQCDVWIDAKFGGHWPLSILVSCKDHSRKLHVGDIGAFHDEVRSTGASTGVIYSRVGFTKPAVIKAKANGLACCRIFRRDPADLPSSISFYEFACKPIVQLSVNRRFDGSQYETWNDLFDIPIPDNKDAGTVLDMIATVFSLGEEWSVREGTRLQKEKEGLFPPDWCSELKFSDGDNGAEITMKIIGRWRRYQARMDATLLNGSYCLSDGSFKGEMIGPSIDTQGDHPGEAWLEIAQANLPLPSNSILTVRYKGDCKEPLKMTLGPCSLYQKQE